VTSDVGRFFAPLSRTNPEACNHRDVDTEETLDLTIKNSLNLDSFSYTLSMNEGK
jgi:hypothetical protein